MAAARIEPTVALHELDAANVAQRDWIPLAWTLVAAGAALVSIAVMQIAMACGLLSLIVLGKRLRFPPILLPLGLFVAWTAIAIAVSPDGAAGVAQLRKFYAFVAVVLVCSTIHTAGHARLLLGACCASAAASAAVAIHQAHVRWQEAIDFQAPPYDYVLDGRITGFLSHWMTFAGVQMIILLMLLAFLSFGRPGSWRIPGWICVVVIWTALILNLTRSVFLVAAPAGVVALAWGGRNKRAWIAGACLLAGLALASPIPIRERVASVLRPHGEVDSNSRRLIMAATGWRMITANPVFGVGPEQVAVQFDDYLPHYVRKPLPKGWYGHLHNVYLQYAAERGLPALVCFVWLMVRVFRDMTSALESGRETVWVFRGVLAATTALLAEGLFEYNLGDSEVLTLYLVVLACGYSLRSADERAGLTNGAS